MRPRRHRHRRYVHTARAAATPAPREQHTENWIWCREPIKQGKRHRSLPPEEPASESLQPNDFHTDVHHYVNTDSFGVVRSTHPVDRPCTARLQRLQGGRQVDEKIAAQRVTTQAPRTPVYWHTVRRVVRETCSVQRTSCVLDIHSGLPRRVGTHAAGGTPAGDLTRRSHAGCMHWHTHRHTTRRAGLWITGTPSA